MASTPDRHPTAALTADEQVSRIFEWRRGFNALHLIDLGLQLGLFRAIAETPDVDAPTLASTLALDERHVAVWLTSAYSFGLLEAKDESHFRLAPFIDQILGNPAHPRYLGGYVQLGTRFGTEDFRHAIEGFRTGRSVPFQGRSDDFARLIGQAIFGVNLLVARKILPGLSGVADRLNAGGSVLEVGCGAGHLQIQIAKAFSTARCTGIDIDPTGLRVAREAVANSGLGDRITLIEGDIAEAIEPASFDVVVMVEVLHEIAQPIRPQVVGGCARALKPGGWLVIVDETYPSTLAESRQPEFLFPVQTGLEELMWGNVIPTREEQELLLRGAGFTGPIDRSLIGEGFTLLATQR